VARRTAGLEQPRPGEGPEEDVIRSVPVERDEGLLGLRAEGAAVVVLPEHRRGREGAGAAARHETGEGQGRDSGEHGTRSTRYQGPVDESVATERGVRGTVERLRERLRKHRRGLLELFVGVLVPLCGLALLARWVVHPQPPPSDLAVLQWIHAHATPERDRMAEWITDLGTWLGVVPITVLLVLYLLLHRKSAQSLFVLLSMVGSWALNDAAKAFYGRERPALWNSATRTMWF